MTKYNQSFKQQVIEFYLQNGKNRSLTRQYFQLAENTLRRWIKQYNYNGFNGLAVLGKNRSYSPKFKLAIIQAVKNGQFSAEYGYRRITLMLRKIWTINHKKVQAIMQKLSLKGKCKRRKYRSYQGEVGKIANNLLDRNFQATKPNEK